MAERADGAGITGKIARGTSGNQISFMNSEFRTRNAALKPRNPWIKTLAAFTLIELLVVIAVIAILAGLLFTAMPAVNNSRMRSVARAELTQISTAIEGYKAKYGFYPPDNPTNSAKSPLYFELVGVVNTNGQYRTRDGGYSPPAATVNANLSIGGIVNSSSSLEGDDDRPASKTFLSDLKPTQLGTNGVSRILVFSQDGTPWNYSSSHPTNNPGSYDLWMDLVLGGKTNRISNWGR